MSDRVARAVVKRAYPVLNTFHVADVSFPKRCFGRRGQRGVSFAPPVWSTTTHFCKASCSSVPIDRRGSAVGVAA